MDGVRDQYEEQLKEVFESFDGSGLGSLCPEELTDLCRTLQLEENTLNTLVHALLQDQLSERVDFEQFKDALILVLSSTNTNDPQECPERPDSPEVQPRFVKGSKRYGRRSAPEFIHTDPYTQAEDEKDEDAQDTDDRTVPRKRERWNADVSISEEFEAEGQLHLWNPDEPSTPCSNVVPLCDLEERFQNACRELSLPMNGMATLQQLHTLCQHTGIEVGEDLYQCADESMMDVQEFVSYIINHSKPPTPSVSTPYRQLKRLHLTQFDETGRRVSCALSSTIGLQLFSVLDDGSGHAPTETLLYRWMEGGVDNSSEILQALDFNLEGKVNLSELTLALENELLSSKNAIHQAALVSFKAEIRHLLECVDLERCEKERIRSDLDKAEKLKSQLASEVDDHHAAIERNNELNLRKLEQEYKESMTALRAELSKEVELVQQQSNQQREELEQEIGKMRDDENVLREHLMLTMKENGRLETELLESTEKLVEAENQINKLQKNLDAVLKDRFGDLDPDSAEFYQQEDRLRQLRRNYEEQCRELQDHIDELETQLEEYQTLGSITSTRPEQSLSEELARKSPDTGLGSQKQQTLNMTLETEMLLEQHQREIENIRAMIQEEQHSAEEERSCLSLQHQQEVQILREEMARALERANRLQLEVSALHTLHQQELSSLMQELQDTRSRAEQLKEQVGVLEEKQTAYEEHSKAHAEEISVMEFKYQKALVASLQEQRDRLQEEREKEERRLTEQWKQELEHLQRSHKEVLSAQLEEVQQKTEWECVELEKRLREEWEQEREKLEEVSKEALQAILEERSERERRLREQQDEEHALLEKQHHAVLLQHLEEEREHFRAQQEENKSIMMEHWCTERSQLEKQSEEALQASLKQERERLQAEREEEERRWQHVLNEEQNRMEETHRKAMQELSAKHCKERERLSSLLEKLRTDIAEERSEVCRLAKENLILKHKISTVREEDLRENQENFRLQHINQGKRTAQAFHRQLSEPRRLGQQLEEDNILLQQTAEHFFRHTGQEVMRHHDQSPGNEMNGFQLFDRDDFVSRTEKELLRAELHRCIEKVMSLDSSLQTLTQQNARLKSDLRITQQERDALKQEVISLHKQMQSANEKLLKVSVVSAGQQQGRRVWAELSCLMEAEHDSLTAENQQLKRQISEICSELQTAKDQIRQLEVLSMKHRGLVKTADQEKSALKREMESLHAQLLSARNKAQLAAVLPSSPLQLPGEQRRQHHGDGPNFNMKDEREVVLLQMEERMSEVELMLRNLKLLLQEKVSQLKEQLTRNGEADVLIKDLYVENAQLLKALEKTEQRQKVVEKKNFLLEEKISSLNKIVRDLGPSPLTPTPYHFTHS
ncbi:ninein-like isoform X1 [Xyrauchen texanus]|uniref:ninein-like isoform X1 n=1 Tax=Xyrauchen texanus TaxID=154827 RepID=UPI0022420A7D|nr:ninein-like isoform X1 [Xyrauchen texanus]